MIHYVIVGILVVVSTVLVRFGLEAANILPESASLQAGSFTTLWTIDWLFGVQMWFISFFFSLIVVFLIYSIIVFRRRGDEEEDGAYFEGSARLEVVWTIVPLGIVLLLAVIGAQTLSNIERRDPQALEVNVIGQQWAWRFEYPESGVTSAELVLPRNRQVLLRLRSEDVIHSFWVPEFRVKQDALPATGEEFTRELRLTPTKLGNYKVRCAELCGSLHYSMLADVRVVIGPDFDIWLAEQGAECDLGAVECGQRWSQQYGCVACHSLDGTVVVGPSWLGLAGSEIQMSDGTSVLVDEAYLRESILEPNALLHEGFNPDVMPKTFGETLTDEQIDEIIAFIQSLGE